MNNLIIGRGVRVVGTVAAGAVMALVAVAMPLTSFAAYFNAGQAVDVGAAQAISQNAYVAGGTVTFSAPVTGDLLAAGGTVILSSKATGDIMAVGGTVITTGASAQDLRIAGGNVTIGSTVSGELMAAGAQVMVLPGTTITKDSYIRGASITFNGDEAGNLDVGGSAVVIGGTVEKNLTITAAKSVTIAQGAVIKGNLEYTAPVAATIADGAQILGTTTFHQASAPAAASGAANWAGPLAIIFTFWFLAKFLMILLLAYLIWYIFRNDAVAMLEESTKHFWRSLLRGFIFMVALPIAIIIVCVTVVGIMAGVIAALVYAALIMLAFPAATLMASSLIMKCRTNLRWYHILLGAVVLQIVAFIPFVGWLACLVVWLAAFGALLAAVGKRFAR